MQTLTASAPLVAMSPAFPQAACLDDQMYREIQVRRVRRQRSNQAAQNIEKKPQYDTYIKQCSKYLYRWSLLRAVRTLPRAAAWKQQQNVTRATLGSILGNKIIEVGRKYCAQ